MTNKRKRTGSDLFVGINLRGGVTVAKIKHVEDGMVFEVNTEPGVEYFIKPSDPLRWPARPSGKRKNWMLEDSVSPQASEIVAGDHLPPFDGFFGHSDPQWLISDDRKWEELTKAERFELLEEIEPAALEVIDVNTSKAGKIMLILGRKDGAWKKVRAIFNETDRVTFPLSVPTFDIQDPLPEGAKLTARSGRYQPKEPQLSGTYRHSDGGTAQFGVLRGGRGRYPIVLDMYRVPAPGEHLECRPPASWDDWTHVDGERHPAEIKAAAKKK